jgi:deoxyribose-phosphate aldolase
MKATDLNRIVQVVSDRVQQRLQPGENGGTKAVSTTRSWHREDAELRTRRSAPVAARAPAETPALGAAPRTDEAIARMIDHTLLKPEASDQELRSVCAEARQYNFATVCVNSCNVKLVAAELAGSRTLPIAVVGFPLGAQTPEAKAYETRQAVRDGAREIDMVVNLGAVKSRHYDLVFEDIVAVVAAAQPYPVKVILETAQLNDEEKVAVCALTKAARAAFVKTSTGFSSGGATLADIALMRRAVGPDMGVKASGGVRSRADADAMIAAGATRLGCSSSVAVVTGGRGDNGY